MSYAQGAAAYQQSRILGSSPEQLVVLLYEHLLLNLKRTAAHIQKQEYEEKARTVEKANDIVFELMSSLDMDAGGELASRLNALYAYFIGEIAAVSRSLDVPRLEKLIALVATLHESWAQAARQVAAQRAEPGAGAA